MTCTQICLVALFAASLLGCGGSSSKLKLAAAAGVARYKDKPVTDATVTFYPEKGPPGVGRTDSEGKFQIKTNGQLGAVVGVNKVTVGGAPESDKPPPMDGKEMKLIHKSVLPKKYASASTTDLSVDVPAGGDKEMVLDLTD